LVSLFVLPSIQTGVTINENYATVTLPTSIDFHLDASSDVPIQLVELEFRTDALVCGESASEVVPDEFTVGQSITADWTWDLRRTGSLPLGTTVSWRWVLYTEAGERIDTPEQQIVLTDDLHPWQSLESESLAFYWYEGSAEFAQILFDAGEQALARLEETIGVDVQQQIRVYIYPDSTDMQSATLFAPDWSGGLAFSPQRPAAGGVSLLPGVGPARHRSRADPCRGRALYIFVRHQHANLGRRRTGDVSGG
jgi:hypothetical protein